MTADVPGACGHRIVGPAAGRNAQWTTWLDVDADESDFERLGAEFDATAAAIVGRVGDATARLMRQPAVVDFATAWMAVNRGPGGSEDRNT
ncbi:AAC(3) family N-acetyltransferase [Actinoplanes sp. NPDC049118]|uniref:AAC(3) family N-acetyltransferase n=1 Tax=Actinoplanes sp. NPDC049118 TaxID=3155769 RepID=UPI003401450F